MSEPADRHPYLRRLIGLYRQGRCSRREFLRTATLLGLSAASAYAVIGRRLPLAADLQRCGGTLRVSYRVLDIAEPHGIADRRASNLVRQTLEYLSAADEENVIRPHLLERWQPSDDLRRWTLHLRRNVRWHNGRRFTADDVVWNLRRVLDPATGSSVEGLMRSYMMSETEAGSGRYRLWDANAIEKLDDFTVRLNLKQPQLAVPEHLFHYQLAMRDPEEGDRPFGVGSNGTGPFELVEHAIGVSARLRARSDYWGEGPWLDEVVLLDFGDEDAADVAALHSRQVDIVPSTDATQLESFRQIADVEMHVAMTASTAVARMKPVPPFDDKRVRQAMRLATDCQTVTELALGELGFPAEHHHVSEIQPDYASLPPVQRDVAAARQRLAEAGYPDGIDIEITCPNWAWMLNVVQVMVEQWHDAGIRCAINVVPQPLYNDIWTEVPFGFTNWGHRPLGVTTLALAYRSGVPWNESDYANPEFDRLLDEAEMRADIEERREIMAKLQAILQDDGPIVQPAWRAVFSFAHQSVGGYRQTPTTYFHCNQWYLRD